MSLVGSERRDARILGKRRRAAVLSAQEKHRKWLAGRGPRYWLTTTPGSVSLRATGWCKGRARSVPPTKRGIVRGWSAKSKRRLRLIIASIPWPEVPYLFLTLTYPEKFSHDPAVWKRDLNRFSDAWRAKYGPVFAVWVLEFQRRGAPHFHLVLIAPPRFRLTRALARNEQHPELEELRRWYASTWHRIVTGCAGDHDSGVGLAPSCDPWHYQRHMADEHCQDATGARAAISYLFGELGKESQKSLPEFLAEPTEVVVDGRFTGERLDPRGAGRWWGIWGFAPHERAESVTLEEYHAMRDALVDVAVVVAKLQHFRREHARELRLAAGKRWTEPKRPPGPPRPYGFMERYTVMDPDLRPYAFAGCFRAFLRSLRDGGNVLAPYVALDRLAPAPTFAWS